ncbi:hypothetical protein COH56_06800, partial [Neisseria meningitidis]|uniref:hypothetical protein n=1 Tax=Neisseria meningitidis TaxID=487 RepID=UPI000FF2605F
KVKENGKREMSMRLVKVKLVDELSAEPGNIHRLNRRRAQICIRGSFLTLRQIADSIVFPFRLKSHPLGRQDQTLERINKN